MTNELMRHPELLMGPNPFIEVLPPYLTALEMAKKFGHYPLTGKPWKQLPPAMREPLLEFASEHVAPTSVALPIALSAYSGERDR